MSGAVTWKREPDGHDYPAATSFLALLAADEAVAGAVARLRGAGAAHFAAKDVLRAASLPPLAPEDPHVGADLAKISGGVALSPVLPVRGDARYGVPLVVADGYHRVCAAYHTNENTVVPCRVTHW